MAKRSNKVSFSMIGLGGAAVMLLALWAGAAYRLQLMRAQRSAVESELVSWALMNRYIESLSQLNDTAKNLVLDPDPERFADALQRHEARHVAIAEQVRSALSHDQTTWRHFAEVHRQSLELLLVARESAAAARTETGRLPSAHVDDQTARTAMTTARIVKLNEAYLGIGRGLEKIDGTQRQRVVAGLTQSVDSLSRQLAWVVGAIAAAAAVTIWLLTRVTLRPGDGAGADEKC